MKKSILSIAVLLLSASMAVAVPAKRGLWKTFKLTDGTEVRAQRTGDEHLHGWTTADGQLLVSTAEGYAIADAATMPARRKAPKRISRRRVTTGERTSYTGKKKGLVILAEYQDIKFKKANTQEKYKRILNEEGYATSEGFRGSVGDYFKAQSGRVFELDFDVVGPVTMKYNRKHYGENNDDDEDVAPEEMIVEACKGVDDEVNFADYDWDGDGEADQVFVLYAGTGEADSYDDDAVWPHMYQLSYAGKALKLDNTRIDTYACSNETDMNGKIEGIGTFCHEFSHCMGFPDFYDISYQGIFGTGDYDLMCSGSYNGDGFIPAGYTAYEKMMAGWLEPIELCDADTIVNDMQPLSQNGQAFIIYNKAHPDEYYMLENRQRTGWDAKLPTRGMMISHVDFDSEVWENNIPNSVLTSREARDMGLSCGNDHARMTIFHADNDDDKKYWSSFSYTYSKTTLEGDFYPYNGNNCLTATSTPAATLFNTNTNGKRTMDKSIVDITQNADGSMGFTFRTSNETPIDPQPVDGYLFYESFNKCEGTGGNDGKWSGSIATKAFKPDYEGWESLQAYGASHCARFGTSAKVGQATTPSFTIDGEATLNFQAAAWGSDGNTLTLSIEEGNATITPNELTIQQSAWTDCTATIKGKGRIRVTFTPARRLFLDEVKVFDPSADAIREAQSPTPFPQGIFDLQGRRLSNGQLSNGQLSNGQSSNGQLSNRNLSNRPIRKGLYIVNGRKVVR